MEMALQEHMMCQMLFAEFVVKQQEKQRYAAEAQELVKRVDRPLLTLQTRTRKKERGRLRGFTPELADVCRGIVPSLFSVE